MKKGRLYNFWLLPKEEFYQSDDMPYSIYCGTIATAKSWANILLEFNQRAHTVIFKSSNGRKEYSIERK